MRRSLRVKLTLFVAVIVLLQSVLLIGFGTWYVEKFFLQEKTNEIESLYDQLTEAIKKEDFKTVEELAVLHERRDHIGTVIRDEKGKEVYRIHTVELSADEEVSLYQDEPQLEQREEHLLMWGKVLAGKDQYYIFLSSPLSAVRHTAELILRLNIIISVIALFLGMAGAWIVGERFTRPILEMDRAAKAMARLDFSKNPDFSTREDELGTLGRSICQMSIQLSDTLEKLQAANEQLKEDVDWQKKQDKVRKEFMINVAHELKSPLALLTMSCANLKNERLGSEDRNYYCDVIMDECLRLGTMVQKLLEITRLENVGKEIEKEKIELSKLVQSMLEKFRTLFEEKGIQVTTRIEKDVFIWANDYYLEQALTTFSQVFSKIYSRY
ncbi:MAG: HAMP domain-containing protein [Lachnospiraceae bacterium]|nr:HAMP domain-containing protein [Lachnospiraceae bacterium]